MISMLRKEAYLVCFTKASAKADNLITAVQTGNCLMDFRTLMEHKAYILEPYGAQDLLVNPGTKHFHTQERRKSS